ncbi:multidrug efflux SMR transporter [Rossellomorea sp. YZS02]|uniref:DMT family transporter n=1 Tax=Rossellomorea sp. YZS02 TaxID=3097358 RepID=UPI002A0F369E|nr:multidrug efflux SMR transporter [Rossellomorea sp. YZS02]MDX8342356.1 multidrug efflux SMR transporter [Rossellomorea sp. YZS02]
MLKYYLLLSLAIILEVIGASFMKLSDGFSEPVSTLIVLFSYSVALGSYIWLTKEHEIGIVNALWAGGGTVLVSVMGLFLFQESLSALKLFGLLCIIAGVIGLNLPEQKKEVEA